MRLQEKNDSFSLDGLLDHVVDFTKKFLKKNSLPEDMANKAYKKLFELENSDYENSNEMIRAALSLLKTIAPAVYSNAESDFSKSDINNVFMCLSSFIGDD